MYKLLKTRSMAGLSRLILVLMVIALSGLSSIPAIAVDDSVKAVTNLTVTVATDGSNVTLNWTTPISNPAATKYYVGRGVSASGSSGPISGGTAPTPNSYVDPLNQFDYVRGMAYDYWVTACVLTPDERCLGPKTTVKNIRANKNGINASPITATPVFTDIMGVARQGNYMYLVASFGYFQVVDISNPQKPVIATQIAFNPLNRHHPDEPDSNLTSVAIKGNYAYVGDSTKNFSAAVQGAKIRVVDISNPLAPYILPDFALVEDDFIMDMLIDGDTLYAANYRKGLTVVDISNPIAPVTLVNVPIPNASPAIATYKLAMKGTTLYVADSSLRAYDVSSPASPVLLSTLAGANYVRDVDIYGNYAYVTDSLSSSEIKIVDITNPAAMSKVGSITPEAGDKLWSIDLVGRYAYIQNAGTISTRQPYDGIKIYDLTNPLSPAFVALKSSKEMSGALFNRVYMAGDKLLAINSGNSAGMVLMDVSTPGSLTVSCAIARQISAYSTTELTANGNYLYVVNDDGTFGHASIYNVTDKKTPKYISTFKLNNHYLRDAYVDGNYLYVAVNYTKSADGKTTDSRRIDIYSVADPLNVSQVGTLNLTVPGVNTMVQSVKVISGKAYIGYYEGMAIADVSNPASPRLLSTLALPGGYVNEITVANNKAYIANGALGFRIVDVTNPAAPSITGSLAIPNYTDFIYDTNATRSVAINGQYAYLATTPKTGNGLKVIDISNPTAPREVISLALSPMGAARSVIISEGRLYAGISSAGWPYDDVYVYDITNPISPVLSSTAIVAGDNSGGGGPPTKMDIVASGQYIYARNAAAGAIVVDTFDDALKVEKTISATSVSPGDTVTMTVKITNPSPYTLHNLVISEPISTAVSYVTGSATSGARYDSNDKIVSWIVESLPAYGILEKTYKVRVN